MGMRQIQPSYVRDAVSVSAQKQEIRKRSVQPVKLKAEHSDEAVAEGERREKESEHGHVEEEKQTKPTNHTPSAATGQTPPICGRPIDFQKPRLTPKRYGPVL